MLSVNIENITREYQINMDITNNRGKLLTIEDNIFVAYILYIVK